jgi:hypothetical protein
MIVPMVRSLVAAATVAGLAVVLVLGGRGHATATHPLPPAPPRQASTPLVVPTPETPAEPHPAPVHGMHRAIRVHVSHAVVPTLAPAHLPLRVSAPTRPVIAPVTLPHRIAATPVRRHRATPARRHAPKTPLKQTPKPTPPAKPSATPPAATTATAPTTPPATPAAAPAPAPVPAPAPTAAPAPAPTAAPAPAPVPREPASSTPPPTPAGPSVLSRPHKGDDDNDDNDGDDENHGHAGAGGDVHVEQPVVNTPDSAGTDDDWNRRHRDRHGSSH